MTAVATHAGPTFTVPPMRLRNPVRIATMDAKDVGRRIRTARAWADLSQPELAELLEVSPSTVTRWERGKALPKRSELFYIAEVTGVDRSWFTQGPSEDAGLSALEAAAGDVEKFAREEQPRESERNDKPAASNGI